MLYFKKKKFLNGRIFLVILIISGLSIFLAINAQEVRALSSNYNKAANNPLSIANWNNLVADFLAKSGNAEGVMSGILNMGNNRIVNVGDPVEVNDLASSNYVNNTITSLSGGAVFVNWGRSDCPTGTNVLYNGFSFGSEYADEGGGNELICMQAGGTSTVFTNSNHSLVQPLITVNWPAALPMGVTPGKFIRCAVCYNSGSSCYVKMNGWDCEGAYTAIYQGYIAGAIKTAGPNYTTRNRSCINSNFDSSDVPLTTPLSSKGIVQGTKIDSNLGLTAYTTGHFTRCAVCCN